MSALFERICGSVHVRAALLFVLLATNPASARDKEPREVSSESGGWQTLFNGRSHQFRGYKLFDFPRKSWKVERGELKSIPGSPHVDLISLELYDDFELEVQWRVASGGEGGLYYRVMEDEGPTWHSGLKYPLMDDSQRPDMGNTAKATGCLYEVAQGSSTKPFKLPGQYNISVIRVHLGQVEHWLNGEKVLAYRLGSPEFRDSVQRSRFKNMPRYGRELEGHVGLQHNGDELAFRMIRIRRLGLDEQAQAGIPKVRKTRLDR